MTLYDIRSNIFCMSAEDAIQAEMKHQQDLLLQHVADTLTERATDLPVLNLPFLQDRLSSLVHSQLETRTRPDLEAHLDTLMDYALELSDTDRPNTVHDRYANKLLAYDPVWQMLDGPGVIEAAVRNDILTTARKTAETLADWIDGAEEDSEDFMDVVESNDLSTDEATKQIDQYLTFISLMDEYREHLSVDGFHSALSQDRVRDWFLDALINGMQNGRNAAVDDIRNRITDR